MVMLDFIYMGSADLFGTERERKIQKENMPAGNAYPSGHLVPSPILAIVETNSSNLPCFTRLFTSNTPWYFLDFALKRDSNPHHASLRQESQRLRPLGHAGKISSGAFIV